MNTETLSNEKFRFEPTVLLDRLTDDIEQALGVDCDSFLAGKTLAEIERLAIIATIRACNGNKAASARTLGISEKSIYNKMRRLEITNSDVSFQPESQF